MSMTEIGTLITFSFEIRNTWATKVLTSGVTKSVAKRVFPETDQAGIGSILKMTTSAFSLDSASDGYSTADIVSSSKSDNLKNMI